VRLSELAALEETAGPTGREALGIPRGERVLGLLHLGTPGREPAPREREPVASYVDFLS